MWYYKKNTRLFTNISTSNNLIYVIIVIVIPIVGICMMSLFLSEFQIAKVFAKEISLKNINDETPNKNNLSEINISLDKKNENHSTSSLPSTKTVLIVKGAALLRDKAYSPDLIVIHKEDSIIWKNKDDVVHTVTSGSSFSSSERGKEFDSGLLGGTYTHKFMKAGVYNYFCQIHPTMVGKIIVK